MLKGVFILLLVLLLFVPALAQKTNCCVQKALVLPLDTVYFDSIPSLLQTIQVINADNKLDTFPEKAYTIGQNFLIWKEDSAVINIHYKIIPPFITENTSRLDTHLISSIPNPNNLIEYEIPVEEKQQNFSNDLNYKGSFSRGVTFGNSQDLVLNSGLNLQMDGLIGNDIHIKAAISDQNIPLQPEGNTQQLNEFDKVFIQIDKDKNQLLAGDYDIQTNSHFLKYTKNLQGASFQNQYQLNNGKLSNRASIAISKGNFQRQNLAVIEGNQGPYKLFGRQNESFIIILANTEKVFLDGNILTRGASKDYIIDYNQGEITFTTNIPINSNSRIVVEFEYATQNFLKSLIAIDNHFENKHWNLNFHLFSEQESKNTTGLSDLSPIEKQQLADAGDAVGNQFFSGIQSKIDPLNPIFYIQKDTMVNGILYENILVYNPNKNTENKNVKFTNIGANQGNYIRINADANGTIFQWIAPDDMGVPQGNYEPIIKLKAPTQHQIYDLGATYKISENSQFFTEISMSNFDKNRFSKKDKNDDIGMAIFSKYNLSTPFGKTKKWSLNTQLSYEYSDKKYKSYSPFRNPEFNRNWNISSLETSKNTHLIKANLEIQKDSIANISYDINTFNQAHYFQGVQQNGRLSLLKNDWEIIGQGQLLHSKSKEETTRFFKPNLLISKRIAPLNHWKIGMYLEQEKNQRKQSDTLSLQSFYFNQSKWFIESQKSEHLFFGSHFLIREDFAPKSSQFEKNIKSSEYKFFGQWKPLSSFRIEGSWLQRDVSIEHQNWTEQVPKKYQIGQINLNYAPLKGAIQLFSNYEIGGGQEAKLAYNYLEVKSGQGVYQWIDYNQDGQQQINEFEIAPYPDLAKFIRIILPTQTYIATNFLKFNQSLSLIPKAKWHNSKRKIVKYINYLSSQSSFFINRKSNNKNGQIDWNPLINRRNDTLIIADNQAIRNSIFFNRAGIKFNLELGSFNNRQKNILVTGYESIFLKENFLNIHSRIVDGWDIYLNLKNGQKNQNSENFINKNYSLDIRQAQLKITSDWKDKWSNTLSFEFTQKDNNLSKTPNKITQKGIKLNILYHQTNATSIETSINYTKIKYLGDLNTPVSYELLNGLQDGNNFVWELQIHRKISQFVIANIGYNGRKTGENTIIHLGNLQLTAQF